MKILKIYILLTFTFTSFASCQNSSEIIEIQKSFNNWKPVLNNKIIEPQIFYHLYSGHNFSEDEWTVTIEDSTGAFVGEQVYFYTYDSLGYMMLLYETTPSGDWSIVSEHYFTPSGKLYFIFWSMNTSYSDEPVTVERRIYFDSNHKQIKNLQSVYKINTKQKVKNPNFMDRNILYWLNMLEVPFKSLIDKQ